MDKIDMPSLWGFAGYVKKYILQTYQEKLVTIIFLTNKLIPTTCSGNVSVIYKLYLSW